MVSLHADSPAGPAARRLKRAGRWGRAGRFIWRIAKLFRTPWPRFFERQAEETPPATDRPEARHRTTARLGRGSRSVLSTSARECDYREGVAPAPEERSAEAGRRSI